MRAAQTCRGNCTHFPIGGHLLVAVTQIGFAVPECAAGWTYCQSTFWCNIGNFGTKIILWDNHANREPLLSSPLLSSPLLSSPLLSSCRWTSISSSPPHISFLPHSESWPPEWVSRAGTRWGYTACVRLLFIYLISEDALTVTLQLFRHMAPSVRHEKSFQIWWETEVFGDVMQ